MPLSVTDLLGIPGLPTSKRGIQKWLKVQDLPLAIDGQRFTFALSDLPPEVRRAVIERDIAAAGLPLGTYDEAAHQDLAQATPKMREVAERKAAIARDLMTLGAGVTWAEKVAILRGRHGCERSTVISTVLVPAGQGQSTPCESGFYRNSIGD